MLFGRNSKGKSVKESRGGGKLLLVWPLRQQLPDHLPSGLRELLETALVEERQAIVVQPQEREDRAVQILDRMDDVGGLFSPNRPSRLWTRCLAGKAILNSLFIKEYLIPNYISLTNQALAHNPWLFNAHEVKNSWRNIVKSAFFQFNLLISYYDKWHLVGWQNT